MHARNHTEHRKSPSISWMNPPHLRSSIIHAFEMKTKNPDSASIFKIWLVHGGCINSNTIGSGLAQQCKLRSYIRWCYTIYKASLARLIKITQFSVNCESVLLKKTLFLLLHNLRQSKQDRFTDLKWAIQSDWQTHTYPRPKTKQSHKHTRPHRPINNNAWIEGSCDSKHQRNDSCHGDTDSELLNIWMTAVKGGQQWVKDRNRQDENIRTSSKARYNNLHTTSIREHC